MLQLICHLSDARLPISRAARIELRHVVVALLMLFIVVVSEQWRRPHGTSTACCSARTFKNLTLFKRSAGRLGKSIVLLWQEYDFR